MGIGLSEKAMYDSTYVSTEARIIQWMPTCGCTTLTCHIDHDYDHSEPDLSKMPNRQQRRAARRDDATKKRKARSYG